MRFLKTTLSQGTRDAGIPILKEFCRLGMNSTVIRGDDVSELLGVKRYDRSNGQSHRW